MTIPGSTMRVHEIMQEFARLTGLDPASPAPRRYLWTDAFAVCNYLELYCRTGDALYRDLAVRLVDQVHH
ncbi:MAG: glycoside hydrolase family 127 protein, partial [Methanoregula sp.]|nr:glycoside hydrolase family 127 protein [Methanoregula sp.]